MDLRSALIALTACGLVAACGIDAGATASTVPAAAAAAAPAESGVATISATYRIKDDGRVKVKVASDSREAKVKFRSAAAHKRVLRRTIHSGKAKVVLPEGSTRIRAKAVGTARLAASDWVRARLVSNPTPSDPPPTDPPPTDPPPTDPGAALTAADLTEVARRQVYFGHQSVGVNILSGIPTVYRSFGISAPQQITAPPPRSRTGGYISESHIGSNGDPLGKIDDFDRKIRDGIGSTVDVALMKLCFVDITAGTDVNKVFTHYRSTLAALERDYPEATFIHVTAPLTTSGDSDNAARQRLNQLLRSEYRAGGNLFDLAAIESTKPGGARVSGTTGGQRFFALYDGYSDDGGHLDAQGSAAAARGLLKVIAAST